MRPSSWTKGRVMGTATRLLALSLWTALAITASAASAPLKMEVDVVNQLTFYTRPPATGSRLAKAHVRQLPFATEKLVEMVTEPIAKGLRHCPVTVKIATGSMPDRVGDSFTKL